MVGFNVDGKGNQLVNWVAEIRREGAPMNDWNKPGSTGDFIDAYKDWRFDWLDVPALITAATGDWSSAMAAYEAVRLASLIQISGLAR